MGSCVCLAVQTHPQPHLSCLGEGLGDAQSLGSGVLGQSLRHQFTAPNIRATS